MQQQQLLPTLTNLVKWGKATNSQCPLCTLPQTNKHVLSNFANSQALFEETVGADVSSSLGYATSQLLA